MTNQDKLKAIAHIRTLLAEENLIRPKFVHAMSKQLAIRGLSTHTATSSLPMARLILRENLRNLGIRYGDTGYGWTKSDATEMVDYELECGQ